MRFPDILLYMILTVLALQDLRSKAVSLYVLAFLFCLGLLGVVKGPGNILEAFVSIGMVWLLATLLWLYTRLRGIKLKQSAGLGDLLFLFCAALFFPPGQLLLFIILSCSLGIGFFLICRDRKVPMVFVSSVLWIIYQGFILINDDF